MKKNLISVFIIFPVPLWPLYIKMVSPPRTYQYKSSTTYNLYQLIIYRVRCKKSGMSQVLQPNCSLLLSNEPTSALSSKAICNLNDTEWDKLTRSDMAGKLLEHLDKMYSINNGRYLFVLLSI